MSLFFYYLLWRSIRGIRNSSPQTCHCSVCQQSTWY